MDKQHLIESQIDITLNIHHIKASQSVIVNQLRVNQSTASRIFRNMSIMTFKTRDS